MTTRKIILVLFLLRFGSVMAQTDSLTEFSFQKYIDIVKLHHPISRQAELQNAYGEANLLKAKGAFDPKLQTEVSQKYFNDKSYYNLIDGGLKIPTWFGIELKTGYEVNDGEFLNNQNQTPNSGLLYAGISLPIGNGLIIDKRRAELKKAKIYLNSTSAQRQILLNQLILEAGIVYWEWYESYQKLQVLENAVSVAKDRQKAVSQSAKFGDRPSIDTLEASIQLQNRQLNLQQAQLSYKNASALLSIYIWADGSIPLEVDQNTVPSSLDVTAGIATDLSYYALIDTQVFQHPELVLYANKLEQLEIQKKLNKEQLKPTLNLKYNPITEPISGDPLGNYSVNNYTWGIEFSMPLLLRKERGNLNTTNLQIQDLELDFQNKQASLIFKAKANLNAWQTAFEQVELYQQTVEDTRRLFEGEQTLFFNGERSLFMVNAREQSYIKAQQKLIELFAKNQIAKLKTIYTFGLLAT